MSVTGVSSISSGGSLYDFTNLTSKQAISAAGDLAKQGAITDDQYAILAGDTPALANSSGRAMSASSQGPLNFLSTENYFKLIQNDISSLENNTSNDPDIEKALAGNKAALQAITEYQGQIDPYATSTGLVNQ